MRSDEELLVRAREGDDVAFGELVERHTGRLYRLALGLVGQAADAEDVVQETWTGAYRGRRAFDGRSSVRTWLSAILARQAARVHRGRGRRHQGSHAGDIIGDIRSARSIHIIDATAGPRPAGTVESRLFRARQALRERFGSYLEG